MAVVARKVKSGTAYWVATYIDGRYSWERSGTNKRAAELLDAQRKRELKAGTFSAESKGGRLTVAGYAAQWLRARRNRTVNDDRQRMEHHVLSREWIASKALSDLGLADGMRLVNELQTEMPVERQSTIKNIWGVFRTMVRDASINGLVHNNVTTLPRGVMRKKKRNKRTAYKLPEVEAILTCPDVSLSYRVLWALLLFTGMREGEAVGRRWRDWDRDSVPMGALHVHTQYNDLPLKEDEPRMVPVHPTLARILEEWWAHGWELFTTRRPTPDDFIVPNDGRRSKPTSHLSKSGAYKAWRKSLIAAGVSNRSLHSTRNTFITWARRNRCDPETLERITHNAAGTMVDQYTDWQWEPLCEVVSALPFIDARIDCVSKTPRNTVEAPGIEADPPQSVRAISSGLRESGTVDTSHGNHGFPLGRAQIGANQSHAPAAWSLALVAHRFGLDLSPGSVGGIEGRVARAGRVAA